MGHSYVATAVPDAAAPPHRWYLEQLSGLGKYPASVQRKVVASVGASTLQAPSEQ